MTAIAAKFAPKGAAGERADGWALGWGCPSGADAIMERPTSLNRRPGSFSIPPATGQGGPGTSNFTASPEGRPPGGPRSSRQYPPPPDDPPDDPPDGPIDGPAGAARDANRIVGPVYPLIH